MLPVEIQTRFEPIHSILAGLVKFLAVGCGLNEIAGGLRLCGSHIATRPSGWRERTDRSTRNIPSPQRAKPSAVLSGSGDPSFIEFRVFHALSSRHEVTVDCMEATIGTLDNRWIVK